MRKRTRIDARRQSEAPALELALHALIQVQRESRTGEQRHEKSEAKVSYELFAKRHRLDFTRQRAHAP
jgi:hypothetical protein